MYEYEWEGHTIKFLVVQSFKTLWLATLNYLFVDGTLVAASGGFCLESCARCKIEHNGSRVEIEMKTNTSSKDPRGLDYNLRIGGHSLDAGTIRTVYSFWLPPSVRHTEHASVSFGLAALGAWILLTATAMYVAFGGLALTVVPLRWLWSDLPYYAYRNSGDWPSADGSVVSSFFEDQHHPKITYTYAVDDREYQSQFLWPNPMTSGEAFVRDHPTGAAVNVYYDPSNPAKSCLRLYQDFWSGPLLFIGAVIMGSVLWVLWQLPGPQQLRRVLTAGANKRT